MNKVTMLILMLFVISVQAQESPGVINTTGFVTVGWIFSTSEEDLYDTWAALTENFKLKGSVYKFIDWSNVSGVIVIYNGWHLPAAKRDIRLQHIEGNLLNAAFGDKFKGNNPGGTYVFLLQYKNSERQVLLSFTEGVFLLESPEGIGVVDIRGNH